nr:hypothetical protein Itr_chr03CG05780 [Ipomoea trifida]
MGSSGLHRNTNVTIIAGQKACRKRTKDCQPRSCFVGGDPIALPIVQFAGVAGHHHRPLSLQPETPSEELANHSLYSTPLLVKGRQRWRRTPLSMTISALPHSLSLFFGLAKMKKKVTDEGYKRRII